jgi:ribonuclease VapC
MILDTSAILAVLFQEPSHDELLEHLATATTICCGTPTLTEAGIVLGSRLGCQQHCVQRFGQEFNIQIISFEQEHYREAVRAYERYGKGRHPAGLNFGDCLSYAVAKVAGLPLLYVGNDFGQTDLNAVKV